MPTTTFIELDIEQKLTRVCPDPAQAEHLSSKFDVMRRKTKMCLYEERKKGSCPRPGVDCWFAHSAEELQAARGKLAAFQANTGAKPQPRQQQVGPPPCLLLGIWYAPCNAALCIPRHVQTCAPGAGRNMLVESTETPMPAPYGCFLPSCRDVRTTQ